MMPTTEVPALKISGLTKTYNNGFTALKGIDLTVPQGGFFCFAWAKWCRQIHDDWHCQLPISTIGRDG